MTLIVKYILWIALFVLLGAVLYLLLFRKDALQVRLQEIENSELDAFYPPEPVSEDKAQKFKFLRIPQRVKNSIVSAGIKLRVEEFVLIWIAAIFIPGLLFFAAGSDLIVSIALVFAGAVMPPLLVSSKRKKRLELFGTQLGDALMLISNGLRAGFSFEQAMATVAKDMPEPVSDEFAKTIRDLKMGVSLEKALVSMTERTENTDMRLLTSAVLIQRQVGGNLADILDTISVTIQDRIKIKRNIRTLTAQGKISGLIVGSIPLLLVAALSLIAPGYLQPMFSTIPGIVMLCIAVVMEIAGFIVIRKMVNL